MTRFFMSIIMAIFAAVSGYAAYGMINDGLHPRYPALLGFEPGFMFGGIMAAICIACIWMICTIWSED